MWEAVNNAVSYDVQYRKLGRGSWRVKNTGGLSRKFNGLIAQTSYEYQVRAHCANAFLSDWSVPDTFITDPQKLFTEEKQLRIEVQPNPVYDVLNLEWISEEDVPATISIYDLTGKLVFTSSAFNAADEKLQLNIGSWPSGFYFARMNLGEVNQVVPFIKE